MNFHAKSRVFSSKKWLSYEYFFVLFYFCTFVLTFFSILLFCTNSWRPSVFLFLYFCTFISFYVFYIFLHICIFLYFCTFLFCTFVVLYFLYFCTFAFLYFCTLSFG